MKKTTIDEVNVIISTNDNTVKALELETNKNIFFLPVKVAENFPNLVGYSAWECSLKEISKENFAGLNKLKILELSRNAIEAIADDTFADLTDLSYLYLCE